MRKSRVGTIALLLSMMALVVLPTPAMAQTDPEECGNFAPLCEGLQEVGDGISPITDGLDVVTDPAAENLKPLLEALEGGVTQLRGVIAEIVGAIPCDQVQPIIDELQVIIDDVQGVLDVATEELIEAAEGLEGILTEANNLIDDVLDVCVAAEESERPEPPVTEEPTEEVVDEAVADTDVDEGPTLPVTGGGAALGGVLLLGTAGLLATRMRRRS